MNIISYATTKNEIIKLNEHGVHEIVISSVEFSRFNSNSFEEFLSMIELKNKISAKLTFEWDILEQENKFKKTVELFKKIPIHEFHSIRIQDPGVVHFIKTQFPWLKIQLILETGNHNLVGLKKWEEYLGDQLERLILSNELSKEHLKNYGQMLKTPIEVLCFGRILLFYSPRGLLKPLYDKKENYIEASGTSEESPHSGFPLIENRHGTFMFNVKDLSLIEHVNEMLEMNIFNLRLDLRFDHFLSHLALFMQAINNRVGDFKIDGPRPFIKGFYNINKTDVLFVKLKNNRIARNDANYLAEVVDVEKDVNLVLKMKKNFEFKNELKLKIVTPEGKEKNIVVKEFLNSQKESLTYLLNEKIVIIPFVNGVTVKSQVYLDSII